MAHENYDLEIQGDGYRNRVVANLYRFFCNVMIITLIYGLFVLAYGLVLILMSSQRPYLPHIEIEPAPHVAVVNVSNYNQLITANLDIVFRFKNPNKIAVSFDQLRVLLFDGYDHNHKLIPPSPFVIGPKEATDVHALVEDVTMDVDGWISYDGTGNRTSSGSGMTTLNAKVTIQSYKSRKTFSKTPVEANCDNIRVLFSSNSNMTTIAGSNDCTVYYADSFDIVDKIWVYGVIIIVVCLYVVATIVAIVKHVKIKRENQ